MQLFYQRFNVQEYLLFTLLGIVGIVLFANFIGSSTSENLVNVLSITLSGGVMVLSVLMVSKYGLQGNHGKAWILFMLFAAYWFCAESVDFAYELILKSDPWEYADDFFYITGYQLFFASLLFYLKPFVKQISKKLIFMASLISLSILIPSTILVLQDTESVSGNLLLLLSYPVLDSILLIPALIGVFLFFRGGINFMFSLLCLGIITQIIGDNSMLFLTLQNQYFPGHLADTLFLWSYVMFSFGLAKQLHLFNENPKNSICSICGLSCSGHI